MLAAMFTGYAIFQALTNGAFKGNYELPNTKDEGGTYFDNKECIRFL